jgi:peptidoglycan hydrolase-like protein with peptidoglycan-binding domain
MMRAIPAPGLDDARDEKACSKSFRPAAMTSARSTAFSGAGTRAAVRAEQLRLGLPADGWPDQTLLGKL